MIARRFGWAAVCGGALLLLASGQSLAADPQSAAAWIGLLEKGDILLDKRALGSAVAALTEAIRQDPKNAAARRGRGIAYRHLGEWDRALADLNESIRLDPRNAMAFCDRAVVCIETRFFTKAIFDGTEAIRLAPAAAIGYETRGCAHQAQGECAKALADFTRAIELQSQFADSDAQRVHLLERRGLLYSKMGDNAKAEADFDAAQKLGIAETEEGPTTQEPALPREAPPAAEKPSRDTTRDVFGPALLGLALGDEMRVHYASSGCFHFTDTRFVFRGDAPDAVRTSGDTCAIPLNQNDWRRLRKLLTAYRSDNNASLCTTSTRLGVAWFKNDAFVRREEFTDSSGKGSVLAELAHRATPPRSPKATAWSPVSAKTYAVADIVGHRDARADSAPDFAPLVGLIYELVRPDSWRPGAGCDIEIAAGERPALLIRQTEDGHRAVARLLAFLRQLVAETAHGTPAVCYECPQVRKTMESLSRKVTLDYDGQPLRAVMDDLQSRYGLDARLANGIAADAPVTLCLRDVSLRSALRLMVASFDAELALEDGGLLITTSQGACDAPPVLAAYRVDDLIGDGPGRTAAEELVDAVANLYSGSYYTDEGWLESFTAGGSHYLIVNASLEAHDEVAESLHRLRTVSRRVVESPEAVLAIPVYASPPEQAAGESIARALTKRISLDCRGKRLADFAAEIRTATGANVVLDGGVDGDNVRITAIASNVDVRSVLRHALAEHLLTWEARHEAIVICAALDKTRYGPTVAYLAPKTDINALRAVMQATVNPSEWDGFGESGYALRLSLGKTRFLAISDSEAVHAEIARLLALLDAIERETAAGRPALCYGQDFADGSLRSAVAKTLSRKVSLDIEKQPLQAVLTDLKTRYGLDAAMDEKDGDVLRIAGNALVSVRVEDVSLRTALKQMLRPLGLSWMAGESKVTIARLDFGDEFRTTRFYPVADLVGEKDAAAECRNALDALVETIKVETVGPSVTLKDWEAPDRPSTIVGLALGNAKVLAVNQTDAIHDSVVALLAKLRAARGPRRGVM